MTNSSVQEYVQKRRKTIVLKRQPKEERTFRIVDGLKSGHQSQAFYFSNMTGHKLFCYIAASWLSLISIIGLIALRLLGKIGPSADVQFFSFKFIDDFYPIILGLFGALFMTAYALIVSFRTEEIGRKINAYDDYRKRLERTYPNFDFGDKRSS